MSGWQDGFAALAKSGTVLRALNAPREVVAAYQFDRKELVTKAKTLLAPSTPNLREHPMQRAKRAKAQRREGKRLGLALELRPMLQVTITRVGPRELDDDNLQGALKSYRDGIADALRINDSSPLVRWKYRQVKGQPDVRCSSRRLP